MENDDINSVECYHKNDLEIFQKDLTLRNFVAMNLDGSNRGDTNNVWTYYGNLTFSLSEAIILVDNNDEIVEKISELENPNETILEVSNQYAVVLLEKVNLDTKNVNNVNRDLVLYIY